MGCLHGEKPTEFFYKASQYTRHKSGPISNKMASCECKTCCGGNGCNGKCGCTSCGCKETKAIRPPPLIDSQITPWTIFEVEMRECGHSGKLGLIVDSSLADLIGDRPMRPLLEYSSVSH